MVQRAKVKAGDLAGAENVRREYIAAAAAAVRETGSGAQRTAGKGSASPAGNGKPATGRPAVQKRRH